MRKLATFAALTLCAGTAVIGGAAAADAAVNIGIDDPSAGTTATTVTPMAGTPDFASTWCGAPWLWTSPDGGSCGTQVNNAAAK
ncbi:hypothetical protein [Catenulispora pinisilvae]|uniref:hypothetical protein n=1 Tax=Catenulispora pinisilvae TaxID=2705253 RepID=UPI001891B78C|nr:hypothetical protein [Catenulispora pinisilvae]